MKPHPLCNVMLRVSARTKRRLDQKRKEGYTLQAWITRVIERELDREDERKETTR